MNLSSDTLPEVHQAAAFVTLRNGVVTHVYQGVETPIVAVQNLIWTFDGEYEPSLYNALAICAGAIGAFGGLVPDDLGEKLAQTQLDKYAGRLTRLVNERGVHIIADYAHEKKSLVEIARLAHKLKAPGGKVYGVVRLAYDRTDTLVIDTGKTIASEFDYFVVYDKIDGFIRQPKKNLQFDRFTQEIGKTSQTFFDAISSENSNAERIIREDEAIARVAELAQEGDVVVVIVNDDIEQSIGFIQKSFTADFL